MRCSHCDNELTYKEASIPESVICYKAGREDPDNPENRIVWEAHCPNHGVVFSPGGGICGQARLEGGPWDGRQVIWGPGVDHDILVDVNGVLEKHRYVFVEYDADVVMVYKWSHLVEVITK